MQTHEIRQRFIDHFTQAGHAEVPSASLVLDDPNLLFVNAGMVPFKPYFGGQETPPWPLATSIQKCVRTLDIEEVGITTRHNTFFQMAGNFSFGQYFKEGAIKHAWQLLTGAVAEGGFGIGPERLWATVYLDDDEAFAIWRDVVGVDESHIQRRGMKDNFWSMGVPGPCGPCSEIFYDRGPEYGVDGGPEADEDRYIEIWNLVFMQNVRGEGDGKDGFEILGDLPQKNIDTGMGIERVAFLLQGVDNVYETDLLRPIIDAAEKTTGATYAVQTELDRTRAVHFRVIADHSRTAIMLINEGITPGNEGRGYILRRLLRRIVRSARLLGATGPTVADLVSVAIAAMIPSYPELEEHRARIVKVAAGEEEAFLRTLESGTKLFEAAVADAGAANSTKLSGDQAFALHDTHGFPIDLTLEMAAEAGLTVDEAGFRALMAEQRQRAKADSKAKKHGHTDISVYRPFLDQGETEFLGYDHLAAEALVQGIVIDGQSERLIAEGSSGEIVLNRTPLYAEAGGQTGDHGSIQGPTGTFVVTDVQKIAKKVWVHRGHVSAGTIAVGETVAASTDSAWRHGANQGHSATHLVHAALHQVVGRDAVQAGSLNRPGYLRFDFTAQAAVTPAQLREVEEIVNGSVDANYPVITELTTLAAAKARGAMALFGENYGDEVRLVDIGGPFSLELCGGTHVESSAQIGPVTVISESSIGSGKRRIEAVVGMDAYRTAAKERAVLSTLSATLKTAPEQLPERIDSLVEQLKQAERAVEELRRQQALAAVSSLAEHREDIGGVSLIAGHAPTGTSAADLRSLVTQLAGTVRNEAAVVALFGSVAGKVPFVVSVTQPGQDRGLKAGALVAAVAPIVGGRGGGKADVAQGSGTDAGAIDTAIAAIRQQIAG